MATQTADEIRPARDEAERLRALELRRQVFCDEQGVEPDLEADGRDGEALHLVAIRGDAVVGTCRLLFDGPVAKLGRMAVASPERGAGLGAALLEEAIARARAAGAERIALHAQAGAVSLYARAGFQVRGERFHEAGIEHVRMELGLEPASRDDRARE